MSSATSSSSSSSSSSSDGLALTSADVAAIAAKLHEAIAADNVKFRPM